MNNNFIRLKNEFNDITDLVLKQIKINRFDYVRLAFLETLASQDKIHDYILKNMHQIKSINHVIDKLPASNIKKLKNYDECEYYIYNGYTILFIQDDIYAIETKASLYRNISENENEPSLKGPKCAFTENYQINLGLIKRRIKSHNLKVTNINIGRLSTSSVGILSIKGICKNEIVNNTEKILKNIDIDLLNDVEELTKYFNQNNIFPTIIATERPDRCANALCHGKVVILCDDSPTALIIPAFITDFINPFTDIYNNNTNINITKIIRYLCFIISIMMPAFYIAIVNYNQEAIPTSLIINFQNQRQNVPFPEIIECLIMLITCEILKESDLRSPTKYGAATSILGAIVLGSAAVSAGLLTPIMIIISAFTYITSLIFPEIEFTNAIRAYRFILLFLAVFWGLLGLFLGLIFLITQISKIRTSNLPYTIPLSPFDNAYFKNFFLKFKNNQRSHYLSNNYTKEKE